MNQTAENKLSILLYHQVGQKPGDKTNLDCFCSQVEFYRQMQYLSRSSYQVISLKDALGYILQGVLPQTKSIVLSFDDGCERFYDLTFPILQEFGFPAAIYPVAGFLGKTAAWGKVENPQLKIMSTSMLAALHHCGVEVGAHSISHPKLTQLSSKEASLQIRESKDSLEQVIGAPVTSFAYPHGDFNNDIIEMLQHNGFENALSCINAAVNPPTNPYAIPRKYITFFDDLDNFKYKLRS